MENLDTARDGIFKSPGMVRTYETARIVARTDVPVLITGESGVGKGIVARFIHSHSHRATQPLLKVNCAALPNHLLESELFGYERGAFTGATDETPGKFELANGGIILLDEIAEISLHLQAKLLHVLQDGEYSRLGGQEQLWTDVRVLACTNQRLEEAVLMGTFRDDLYFRLEVIRINIPPLRERKQDITPLSNYFLQKHRDKYKSSLQEIPLQVLKKLLEHDWPGNVRELENVIKRYLILSEVDIEDLERPNAPLTEDLSFLRQVSMLAAEQTERELILQTLERTNWNRKRAARHLNICYKSLLNRIKKWQLARRA
jgi:two-component system response regulator AtoC